MMNSLQFMRETQAFLTHRMARIGANAMEPHIDLLHGVGSLDALDWSRLKFARFASPRRSPNCSMPASTSGRRTHRGACRAPERPRWIDSIRIELEHPVVELLSARRRLGKPIEVANVLPSLFDILGIVV